MKNKIKLFQTACLKSNQFYFIFLYSKYSWVTDVRLQSMYFALW